MPTHRTLMISSAIAAAGLMLTGCAGGPVEHGEVIDKRGYAGSWIPEYENVYRENCTSIRTSSFTTASFSGHSSGSSGSKSSGGQSGSSGRTGKSNTSTTGGTSGGTQPGKTATNGGTSGTTKPDSSGSTTGSSTQPTKQCERQYVGQKQTGQHWQAGKWELQLHDGDRTGWITVSQATYDDTDLHDRI
ncbi:hypothetical protein OG749_47195 (plasmid) [Streptomyces nojiriensis]|uniref:hypothetical protein n=1 Tax=Streptomyces nojiriensis TaxID=66374 RepID=UPI002E181D9A